jgi:hypothetical protein
MSAKYGSAGVPTPPPDVVVTRLTHLVNPFLSMQDLILSSYFLVLDLV